jgi:hypothetical protein
VTEAADSAVTGTDPESVITVSDRPGTARGRTTRKMIEYAAAKAGQEDGTRVRPHVEH